MFMQSPGTGQLPPQAAAVMAASRQHGGGADPVYPAAVPAQRQMQWDRRPGMPTHRPTPAECYGCVDWFAF
jgi:hypothetical protein